MEKQEGKIDRRIVNLEKLREDCIGKVASHTETAIKTLPQIAKVEGKEYEEEKRIKKAVEKAKEVSTSLSQIKRICHLRSHFYPGTIAKRLSLPAVMAHRPNYLRLEAPLAIVSSLMQLPISRRLQRGERF